MKREFKGLIGRIISQPEVVYESPFHLSFDVKIQGDTLKAVFVGDYARALQHNVRKDDSVMMNGFIDNGTLVVGFINCEPRSAVGRQVDVHA